MPLSFDCISGMEVEKFEPSLFAFCEQVVALMFGLECSSWRGLLEKSELVNQPMMDANMFATSQNAFGVTAMMFHHLLQLFHLPCGSEETKLIVL